MRTMSPWSGAKKSSLICNLLSFLVGLLKLAASLSLSSQIIAITLLPLVVDKLYTAAIACPNIATPVEDIRIGSAISIAVYRME